MTEPTAPPPTGLLKSGISLGNIVFDLYSWPEVDSMSFCFSFPLWSLLPLRPRNPNVMEQSPRATIIRYYWPCGLNSKCLYSHSSGARSPWSRWGQGWLHPRLWGRLCPLTPVHPLASGGFLEVFGDPWLVEASLQSLPPLSWDLLPMWVSGSKFIFFY